jgi:protocatechuate 3,4-dioxygenase beta subunit
MFCLILAAVLAIIWQIGSRKDVEPKGSGQAQAQLKPPTSAESTTKGIVQDKLQGKAPEEPAHDRADVFGIVRDEAGSPISGAEVRAVQGTDHDRGTDILTSTMGDGTYSLSGLYFPSASPYQVVASTEGYALAYSEPFFMNNPPKRIDLTLTRGAFLSGHVMDESHRAIPGATLELLKGRWSSFEDDAKTKTDADGAYIFENVSSGEYWLFVFAKRHISQYKEVTIAPSEVRPTEDFLLEYAGEGYFSGVVLDENNQPVEGVKIEGSQAYLDALRTRILVHRHFSSANGSFGLEGFVSIGSDAGKLPIKVVASKEGYEKERITVHAGDEDVLIRLRYTGSHPGSISGRVVEKDSSIPITDFRVEVLGRSGPFASRRFQSSTGEFLFSDIDPGLYDFFISASNRATHLRERLSIKSGEETSVGEIELARGATITGAVRGRGKLGPLSGAMVYIRDRRSSRQISALAGTSADETGLYRLEGVPPGSQYVLASHPDYATTISPELQVLEGKEYSGVDLIMGDGGSIEGHIIDNGVPLAGQMVSMWATGSSELPPTDGALSPVIYTQTNDRGYYREDKLMPAYYYLSAYIPTRRADVTGGRMAVTEIVEVLEGRTTTYDIDLCEGGSVIGRVISEDPIPLGAIGVEIQLRRGNIFSDTYEYGGIAQIITTRVGSSYSFDNVCPGEYTISPYYLYESPGGIVRRNIPAARTIVVEEGKAIEKDLIFQGLIYE